MELKDYFPLASLVTPAVIAYGAYVTNKHFKILRALKYMERFSANEMVKTREAVDSWLSEVSPDDSPQENDRKRLGLLNDKPSLHGEIRTFLNFFFEVSIVWKKGHLDKDITRVAWSHIAPHYFQQLQFYMQQYDNRFNQMFDEFQAAVGN